MKFLTFLFFLLSVNQLCAQAKKYKFQLPQRDKRDTIAFRPDMLTGSFKDGVMSLAVESDTDLPENPNVTVVELNLKKNGERKVKYRFEFFDENRKVLLDATVGFYIDLHYGFAIPPETVKTRYQYKLPKEPYKVRLTWSFYDQPDLTNKRETVLVSTGVQEIELFKLKADYSGVKLVSEKAWLPAW